MMLMSMQSRSGDDESLMEGVQPTTERVQESIAIDLSDDDDNPFISAYIQSNRHAKDVINGSNALGVKRI